MAYTAGNGTARTYATSRSPSGARTDAPWSLGLRTRTSLSPVVDADQTRVTALREEARACGTEAHAREGGMHPTAWAARRRLVEVEGRPVQRGRGHDLRNGATVAGPRSTPTTPSASGTAPIWCPSPRPTSGLTDDEIQSG
ncbi:MAG: hypothetical protein R2838_21990 [Caldilineaceae bacterium]